jgi:hypothetical protein
MNAPGTYKNNTRSGCKHRERTRQRHAVGRDRCKHPAGHRFLQHLRVALKARERLAQLALARAARDDGLERVEALLDIAQVLHARRT